MNDYRASAARCGTRSMYAKGCRCGPCKNAQREGARRWRDDQKLRGWRFTKTGKVPGRFMHPDD